MSSGGTTDAGRDFLLLRTLFEASLDAQYVLDFHEQTFLEVNPAFEALTEYTREEALAGLKVRDLVAPDSLGVVEEKRATRMVRRRERYEIRLKTKSGKIKPCEVGVTLTEVGGRWVVIGSLKDLTETKRLQREMWNRIEELGFANSRIYALTERLRPVPDLFAALVRESDEMGVLETATARMCARDGLGYESVRWYLERDGVLELVPVRGGRRRKSVLKRGHPYEAILHGEAPPQVDRRRGVFPLRARKGTLGVVEIRFPQREVETLQGNDRALQGYFDLAGTLAGVVAVVLENLRLTEEIRRQVITDQLTGVYNRRMLEMRLAEEVSRCQRYGRILSVLMLDLDRFKPINDTLGHRQGDRVLEGVGRLLRMMTREADAVCRYGGDEFAILLPETEADDAVRKAEALAAAIREMEFARVDGRSPGVRVSASIGVAAYEGPSDRPEDILRRADEAMYEAKRRGRDCVVAASAGAGRAS
jgi:diguanylate cyclase (GGDEF)-like protein/PAS domain S-box-containing protein